MTSSFPTRVGELRPSQLLWAHGVGSLVDLPHISVVVRGLDDWNENDCPVVEEKRLLSEVRKSLGTQVVRLRHPPSATETGPFDPSAQGAFIGIPVEGFPEWLRCPLCGVLAPVPSGVFAFDPNPRRMDKTRYFHANCAKGKKPTAVPSRFVVACANGHLDDFPWRMYVHHSFPDCGGPLYFYESGSSLETANLFVECRTCAAGARSMVDAFSSPGVLPGCRGRHPHLSKFEPACERPLRAMLLGASNGWFPLTKTLLSLPAHGSTAEDVVLQFWSSLKDLKSVHEVKIVKNTLSNNGSLGALASVLDDDVLQAIASIKAGPADDDDSESDLKRPEWEVFAHHEQYQATDEFRTRSAPIPAAFSNKISEVVLADRIREVSALVGFTRVEPLDQTSGANSVETAPIANGDPKWVPAVEVLGEGVFLRFDLAELDQWRSSSAVVERGMVLRLGHAAWRAQRGLPPDPGTFPGMTYIMLHTLAHLLINEFSVACGYGAASIRERIYASRDDEAMDMAGLMLYTAAPDSEGTLGGLVAQGEKENLDEILSGALHRAQLCSSDPLCAEHDPVQDRSLHGAACHACTFAAETSCEASNRFLDRALAVATLESSDMAFFGGL